VHPEEVAMRKLVVLAGALALVFPASTGGQEHEHHGVKSGFFFGRIAFENEVIAVDIRQRSRVRVFVTDAEPGGTAEWFDGRLHGERMSLRSASGKSRLTARLEHSHGDWLGRIRLPSGRTRNFAVTLAEFGAGIYRVSVSREGAYRGRSLDGKRLTAQQSAEFLTGRITERSGDSRSFRIMDLSQAYGYSRKSGAPGVYTAIVSRRGTLVYGRSGPSGLRRGDAGRNLLAFDVSPSARPTPGFYFGKVAFSRAVIGVQVDPPDAAGQRRIRIYASDSEPEPRGVVAWFSTTTASNTVSLDGVHPGHIDATITPDLVSGTIRFEDGVTRRFFALPAGDGAGIYDVTISRSGTLTGRSPEAGRFTLRSEALFLEGTLTTTDGRRFRIHTGDLVRNLRYDIRANPPGEYRAILAPRGRFIFGRSSRCGITVNCGGNTIGGDKAC
jgi:hypothetical protein